MHKIYRCQCGNNLTALTDKYLICSACNSTSDFVEMFDESSIDPSFCNDEDGSKEGICPCEVYIAHLINKKCNVIETAVAKEPTRDHCHCRAAISPCGHSISHRLVDACTGQP
jgi:hypothetical protein